MLEKRKSAAPGGRKYTESKATNLIITKPQAKANSKSGNATAMPTADSVLDSPHRSGMVATNHSSHHVESPSNGKVAADTLSGSTENTTNLANCGPTTRLFDCKRRKKISQKGSTFKQNCKLLISSRGCDFLKQCC